MLPSAQLGERQPQPAPCPDCAFQSAGFISAHRGISGNGCTHPEHGWPCRSAGRFSSGCCGADVGNTLVFLLVKTFSAVAEAMATPAPSLGLGEKRSSSIVSLSSSALL